MRIVHKSKVFFVALFLGSHSVEVSKFKRRELPIGSFTEVEDFGPNGLIPCLLRSIFSGANAGLIKSGTCKIGTLDLNYEDSIDESREHLFVDQDFECILDAKQRFSSYRTAALKGKLMILGDDVAAIDANDFCKTINATLVIVETREEFVALADLLDNNYAHIGLIFKGNSQARCQNEDCSDLQWIDGSAWKFTKDIYNGVVVNENSPYIMMVNKAKKNVFHDTYSSNVRKVACQILCRDK